MVSPNGSNPETKRLHSKDCWPFCTRKTFSREVPFHLARRVTGESWKTVTDAWNGYHSVPLRDSDRHLMTSSQLSADGDTIVHHKASNHLGTGTTAVLMRSLPTSSTRNDASMAPFTGMLSYWIIGGGQYYWLPHSGRYPRFPDTDVVRFGLVNQVTNYSQGRHIMRQFKPFSSQKAPVRWSVDLESACQASKSSIIETIRHSVEIFDLRRRTCL